MAALMGEMEALMGVEGPDLMERMAFGKRDLNLRHQTELSSKDKRIRELELQIAATTQLSERGNADVVDSGGGSPASNSRGQRLAEAKTEDEYFAALFGQ